METEQEALRVAKQGGYPVMITAVAGGGGPNAEKAVGVGRCGGVGVARGADGSGLPEGESGNASGRHGENVSVIRLEVGSKRN